MRRLVIRPGAIGDFIVSLPALECLAADSLEVLTSARTGPVLCFSGRVRAAVQSSSESAARHSSAGSETMKSPMAPGRMTSLRIFGNSIAKAGRYARVLCTGHAQGDLRKELILKGINAEEKTPFDSEKR